MTRHLGDGGDAHTHIYIAALGQRETPQQKVHPTWDAVRNDETDKERSQGYFLSMPKGHLSSRAPLLTPVISLLVYTRLHVSKLRRPFRLDTQSPTSPLPLPWACTPRYALPCAWFCWIFLRRL